MARLVFTTLGSLGDLHPMLPVAARLRERGHSITFAVPDHLAQAVTAEGLECSPIPIPSFPGGSEDRSLNAMRARIRERFPALLAGSMQALRSACEGADLIVTHQFQVAAAITGRALGIRWVTLTMFPGFVPSGYTVPQPHWLPALPTPAGRAVNRLTWRAYRLGLRHLSGGVIDDALEASGLAGDDDLFTPGGLSPYLALVLSSPHYSPRMPDWPASVRLTGYALWDEPRSWQSPANLDRFLTQGEAPVLAMTSSSPDRDPARFFRLAADAIYGAGKRGLLLCGAAFAAIGVAPGDELAPGVAAWPYAPLSQVAPACSLVIHHAGFGATMTTIRFGRPAIGVPASFDQWYHAGRIKALGVGSIVEWRKCTPAALQAEIEKVLAGSGFTRRSAELGALIAQEDGAGSAANDLETLLHQG